MKFENEKLIFRTISSSTQSTWLKTATDCSEKCRLFIVTSGYEARNISWINKTLHNSDLERNASYLIVGFEEFPQSLSRPRNDEFYRNKDLPISILSSEKQGAFLELVNKTVEKFLINSADKPVEVHVDYSCMPRLWYCSLPMLLEKALRRKDSVYFWYTLGIYPDKEYPTAGVEDFHVFSGKPSLGANFRTHIFGLGFDRIRSQAIWSIIDPQNLVCFYADPAAKSEYITRVKRDNSNVLSAANYVFTVPINDFVHAYSKIAAIASEFSDLGDVILVPDGPKPLILAASLVPLRLGKNGITCFHVQRRKAENFKPVDVEALPESVGFHFCGRRDE